MRNEDIFTWATKAIHPPSHPVECEILANPTHTLDHIIVFYGETDSYEYLNAFTDVVIYLYSILICLLGPPWSSR